MSINASMSRLFDLDLQLLADSVLTIIAIMALFFALSYFLFDPIRKLMEDRQNFLITGFPVARYGLCRAPTASIRCIWAAT